jgi:predicted nucleic acid-binding protein
MTVERFTLDTNILVYAVDQRDRVRQRLATAVVRAAATKDCILTAQSLCEFYSAATRRVHLIPTDAADVCRDYAKLFTTVSYDRAQIARALTEAVAGRMAFWDALLVATAEANGCAIVLSEDMADGARFGETTVRHPFAGADLSPTARRLTGLRKA